MSQEIMPQIFDKDLVWTDNELRDLIAELEAEGKKLPQLEVRINHHFSKDVYAREMVVPKGSLIIGKIHKHQNLNILSGGEVSVLSIDGVMRVKAPYTFVASPGAKRVFYIHEDATWTVIHGTAETDVDKIEEEFIAKSYDEIDFLKAKKVQEIQGEK